jgi:hypothetical protein
MKTAALIGAVAVLGVTACGGGGAGASAPTVTQTVIRETVTVPASPETTASPATSESEAATPAAEKSTAAVAAETFTMPNLVGENLQLAQDTLQSLGSFVLDQEDASGLNRLQVNDSNWKVCTQAPKAGTKASLDSVVLLASVKLSEDCP